VGLTQEQIKIVDMAKSKKHELIKINAISGAGKTSTLKEIEKATKPKTGLYLAYNKAIATEATEKFGNNIACSTVHSLAYRNVVMPFGLKAGFLRARDIVERVPYGRKLIIFEAMEQFFLSKHTDVDTFIDEEFDIKIQPNEIEVIKNMMNKMKSGVIVCTHGFYLKLFHIMLDKGIIEFGIHDLLMLDEAGDVNPVTLAIFKLLKARLKVMVGDNNQNIYSFNNTINGFEELKNEGILMSLSKSFRVSAKIASKIQPFCRTYLDKDMIFEGVDYGSDYEPQTVAYISRTNSSLVGQMIELASKKQPYNITKPAKTMFELPLIILGLKPGCKIDNPQYKFLEEDVEDYYDSQVLQREFSSLFGYIFSTHSDDISIKSACNLIIKYGPSRIYTAYRDAKEHEVGGNRYKTTLTTAHSSKGLEFDEVIIAHDMNEKLDDILDEYSEILKKTKNNIINLITNEEQEEFRLYYVAVTRAKHILRDAKHLHAGNMIE
jgi:hypothetical protein